MARHLAWLLTLPRAKPYKAPARELSSLLTQVADLFSHGRREEMIETDYPGDIDRANKQLMAVLEASRQIYPPGQQEPDDQINYF